MKSETEIEKEYTELQKQKEAKRKEKEKIEAKKVKDEFIKFKKVFDDKYKGRCFYGIIDENYFWDKMRILEIQDITSIKDSIKTYYRIKSFENRGSTKTIYIYFDTIYVNGKKILYFNTFNTGYNSISDFTKSISEIEKHQKVLSDMYINDNFDTIPDEMYEKTKHGFSFGSHSVSKFFEKFKHLRCEVDPKEFNQILEKEIHK